jgi:hypothetical protein
VIISASRRSDIPAFYTEWFLNRVKAGWVYVRSPRNPHQISEVSLSPKVVDGIVFWTKNPLPLLGRLDELQGYPYYFQFTLNPYGKDAEPNVPDKVKILIPVFRQLSRKIGKERVLWRYDPILFSRKYTLEYHVKAFAALAKALSGYTDTCTVSFLDYYRNTQKNLAPLQLTGALPEEKRELLRQFAKTARARGMTLCTCAEEADFHTLGISHAHCIDRQRLEKLNGCGLELAKDKNQRPACGCAESVDIGAYDTCRHSCLYCYANAGRNAVLKHAALYDPCSPLLFGKPEQGDTVKPRVAPSCKSGQLRFF